jgi:diadenosine tetraphosphate (Ap4A) HIT family hydrolase
MEKNKLKAIVLLILLCLMTQSMFASLEDSYCAFCDSNVLQRQKFYEDDLVIALYTHKPIFPGHCLIIPKRHVQRFEEVTDAEASQMMKVIKQVHQVVQATFHTTSYLLLQKNGQEVGQTVPHVHFHYIPRKTGDTSTIAFMFKMYMSSLRRPMDIQETEKIVSELRQAMNSIRCPD